MYAYSLAMYVVASDKRYCVNFESLKAGSRAITLRFHLRLQARAPEYQGGFAGGAGGVAGGNGAGLAGLRPP
jgi:hypothetical protein